jgi:Alpha/beta hydrolase domain containing 18
MHRWENQLCFRATDRIVRPFEYGLEWSKGWPCSRQFPLDGLHPVEYLTRLNQLAIQNSEEFFSYETPAKFEINGDWLEFTSPVETPFAENNFVRARWFPARNGNRKAVIVLPHWNATLPQHNALCAGLERLGISALRLSLPYHDSRTPAGLTRADYAVSSNIGRTIDATRQAIIDTRCCVDWLEREGFDSVGIVGTSLGSCYAFLASAHDARIRVNVFNHCSTYVADVVWEGLSTRHIRTGLENAVQLDTLRKLWLCISPPSYWDLFSRQKKISKFIYTRYDTTFPLHLSRQVIEGARKYNWRHEVAVLPCGHYTMGEFPFKYITGYEICSFLKRNL